MHLNRDLGVGDWTTEPCESGDMSPLSELRVRAIMPSLKAVNRFEAIRVVQRFSQDFQAEHAFKLLIDGSLAGFYLLYEESEQLYLPYFYIDPSYQASPLGGEVLSNLIEKAKRLNKGIRICALKGCQTKQLCLDHDFLAVNEVAYDIYYEYAYHPVIESQPEVMA